MPMPYHKDYVRVTGVGGAARAALVLAPRALRQRLVVARPRRVVHRWAEIPIINQMWSKLQHHSIWIREVFWLGPPGA